MYSFGILAYNQDSDIIRALESVKYQVEQYSGKNKTEIIIADDASSDNTVEYVRKWLRSNQYLFSRSILLHSDKNQGTCKNIVSLYKEIQGDKFLCFAADDAIAHNNIYEYLDRLDRTDVQSSSYAVFTGNKIQKHVHNYKSLLQRSYQKAQHMRFLSVARVPIDGPTMSFNKRFINNGLLDFISNYSLIEDRPTTYYLFRQDNTCSYGYYAKVMMLYQVSDGSVSHQKVGKTHNSIMTDLTNFYNYCATNDDSIATRYTAKCNALRFSGKTIYKYLNFPYLLLRLFDAVHFFAAKRIFKKIQEEFPKCQDHLDYLNNKANLFRFDTLEKKI